MRKSIMSHYLPDAEPRPIPSNAFIHESVLHRMEAVPAYRPVNFPAEYQVVPVLRHPTGDSAEVIM